MMSSSLPFQDFYQISYASRLPSNRNFLTNYIISFRDHTFAVPVCSGFIPFFCLSFMPSIGFAIVGLNGYDFAVLVMFLVDSI
jgi:hypothetical protein